MKKIFFTFVGIVCMQIASSSVVITGTRIIYPASDKEVTVQLSNMGKTPALVQTWIEADQNTPTNEIVPFVLTPPIFRMEPNQGQTLRIIYTGETLPQDKESVFYLNVLDIPPKPTGDKTTSTNYLQLAIQSKLKLFFRPANLEGTIEGAPKKVKWFWKNDNGFYRLHAINQSPFHVTYSQVSVSVTGKNYYVKDSKMLAPSEEADFIISGLPSGQKSDSVRYVIINDYGANIKGEISISD